jgi:hypothetical protein
MIVPCSRLWPALDASPGEARLHWGRIAGIMIGAMPIANPLVRPLLLAIRGAALGDAMTHPLVHAPVYDDCFVLLQRDALPVAFSGATHAYQRDSRQSPDANRDGRGDVGSVRPGRFVLHDMRNGEEVIFQVKTPFGSDRLPAWRDFDHDGKLSPEEMQRSEDLRAGQQVGAEGTWADSVLFHGGLDEPSRKDGTPAKHRFSIACWTAPRKWRQLVADAARATGGQVDAIMGNAVDLLAAMADDSGESAPPPPPDPRETADTEPDELDPGSWRPRS